jgi:catechol 2,3-dioxygenase-like lactoylglutathione lyase family enzyme
VFALNIPNPQIMENFPPLAGFSFSSGEHMTISLAVISLWAEDVPACTHFYRDVIGVGFARQHAGDRPHFDLGGSFLAIVSGRPAISPEPESRFPVVALSIPELDKGIRRLRLHGVELPWGVEDNASGTWVMFRNPVGNLVELVQFKR